MRRKIFVWFNGFLMVAIVAAFFAVTSELVFLPNGPTIHAQSASSMCYQGSSFAGTAAGIVLDNRLTTTPGCIQWRFAYYSTGFSALSIQVEGAPDNNGAAGSFVVISSPSIGTNPDTDLNGRIQLETYYPWIRVSVTSATGAGNIAYTLNGYNGTVVRNGQRGAAGPIGPTGATGATGTSATATAGTTTTSAPGGSANVVNSGSTSNAIFDFTIPRGATGPTGSTGPSGSSGAANVFSGPIASRPAPGSSGSLYIPTDSVYSLLRDNGVSWDYFRMGKQITPPVAANFSWINQNGATITEQTNGAAFLNVPVQAAGESLAIRTATAPGTPYTKTFRFQCTLMYLNKSECGVGFRESGTGKLVIFFVRPAAAAFLVSKYTSPTAFSADYVTQVDYRQGNFSNQNVTFRIGNTGTNITFEYSGDDGDTWIMLMSVAKNDFFTTGPDQYCWSAASNHASWPAGMTLISID